MKAYIVRQGEYLTQLAFTKRFDADEVWNHPKNANLKALRPNREVLAPGDLLYIPDTPCGGAPLRVGGTNQYEAAVPLVEIAIVLQEGGKALPDTRCIVLGKDDFAELTSDGDGLVRLKVPVTTRAVEVLLPEWGTQHQFLVGYLDPVDTTLGQRARLANLGFYPRTYAHHLEELGIIDAETIATRDEELLRRAIALFQDAHKLPITGLADTETRRALLEAHGP